MPLGFQTPRPGQHVTGADAAAADRVLHAVMWSWDHPTQSTPDAIVRALQQLSRDGALSAGAVETAFRELDAACGLPTRPPVPEA